MSGTDYNYDEQGQFFPYFVLTMLAITVGPVTYTTFAPSKQGGMKQNPRIDSDFKPSNYEQIESHKKRKAKESRRIKRMAFLVLGWAMAGYMVYLIATTKSSEENRWDPYKILGVPHSSSEKFIKKHYRKISLTLHPDKVKTDNNQTIQEASDRWVEITKAYKTLTDEEIRKNFEEYGHPDGKQSFSIGIALPQWTVASGSRWFVLAFYGIMFGMVLPYIVGKWWYGTKKFTKDGVLTEVAGRLFKAYDEDCDEEDMVSALSVGGLEKFTKKGKKDDTVEKAIEDKVSKYHLKKLESMDGWQRRTASLLWAYLNRIDLGNAKLESEKLDVAQESVQWNNSSLAIALAYSLTKPILSSMRLNQCLIQAIPPNESPLLQLPYFTKAVVHSVEQGEVKDHWTIQRLMNVSDERRRKMCIGQGLLTESEYTTAMDVAQKIPILKIERAFFKVQGEKYVTPNAIVQLVVKARIVPAGKTAPPVVESDLIDEDPEEDDINALIGRDTKKANESNKKSTIDSNEIEKSSLVTAVEAPIPTLAHAPYFPAKILPRWHIFLCDAKSGRMIIAPTTITQFTEATDDYSVQTLKLQFGAPPNAGDIPFVMHLVCDAYLGTDIKMKINLHVDDPSAVERIVEDDEISEPDEDSIAGQMQALKSGQPAPKKRKAIKKDGADSDSESEEDESDTDGEQEHGSDTDTDTDTDDE